jgi:hypothetical protein
MIAKEKFFKLHQNRIVRIANDCTDGGDFMLFHPEEKFSAIEYLKNGFEVASVFEMSNRENVVVVDNDISDRVNKIGYIILTKN